MDTEHEEESMETESYSPQKMCPSYHKCDQNVQVDAQSSSEETSTSGNTTTTDVPLALWVKGERIPTGELPKFYDENGVPYLSDYLPSLPEISTREYNLLMIYIKYMQITKIIHQNELTYTFQLQFFNLCKKKCFKSICYIVYPNRLTC